MSDNNIDEVLDEEFSRLTIMEAGIDLVGQLTRYHGVVRMLLEQSRDDAIAANVLLINCDPENPKEIRRLQYEIKRFNDLLGYVERVVEAARTAREDLSDEQAAEIERLLGFPSPATKD